MNTYKVKVTLTIEARNHAEAVTLAQGAIDNHNRLMIESKEPRRAERLALDKVDGCELVSAR